MLFVTSIRLFSIATRFLCKISADYLLKLMYVDWRALRFHCDDQISANEIIIVIINFDFLHGLFQILRIVHHAKMFPDELLPCAKVEAQKIWMKCLSTQFHRIFIAIWDAHSIERVCNYYFGFGANSFVAGCDILWGGFGEWVPAPADVLPFFCILRICKCRRCNEGLTGFVKAVVKVFNFPVAPFNVFFQRRYLSLEKFDKLEIIVFLCELLDEGKLRVGDISALDFITLCYVKILRSSPTTPCCDSQVSRRC